MGFVDLAFGAIPKPKDARGWEIGEPQAEPGLLMACQDFPACNRHHGHKTPHRIPAGAEPLVGRLQTPTRVLGFVDLAFGAIPNVIVLHEPAETPPYRCFQLIGEDSAIPPGHPMKADYLYVEVIGEGRDRSDILSKQPRPARVVSKIIPVQGDIEIRRKERPGG